MKNEIQNEAEHCQIGKNNNKHKNVNTIFHLYHNFEIFNLKDSSINKYIFETIHINLKCFYLYHNYNFEIFNLKDSFINKYIFEICIYI